MKKSLPCQECGGYGEYVEEYIDKYPRYETCGFCKGIGKVSPKIRGLWLQMKKEEKKK